MAKRQRFTKEFKLEAIRLSDPIMEIIWPAGSHNRPRIGAPPQPFV
jgi:hypothetical protein